ncbi:magnesium transporter [Candidatus Woesearchaeota archaeon CG10_big_fil_rev_8_21_14_0_10_37_12]|nr:MAG: magnesium transporter [Candidatus Woesearchaeota archaeon CG10_big_fil_rev_8_21_14_0_10_37_12]
MKKNGDSLHKLCFSSRRVELFKELPINTQGNTLLNLSRQCKYHILERLTNTEIINLLHYLDSSDITDLLQCIEERRKKKLVSLLEKDVRKKVEFLLRFSPNTAAGMMSLDYVIVSKESTFDGVIKKAQKHEKDTGRFPVILVVEQGFLVGELPAYSFAAHKKEDKIEKQVKKIPSVRFDADESEIISIIRRNPTNKVVVLDDDNSVLGFIYASDVLKLVHKTSGHSLYAFAGVGHEEDVFDSPLIKVQNRYKWLILNLFTAFLAASVVGLFQDTISRVVLLAAYMPVVAGMGGNAGTQALAVVVRGLALKRVELRTGTRVILNELLAGAVNGIITGGLVVLVALILQQNPLLGLIVCLAMIFNLIIAGVAGSLVPLVMTRLGKDPATSASIFITTCTDVFGFFTFLGLASIWL